MNESVLFDSEETTRLIDGFVEKLADLVESPDGEPWALVGIHRRGDLIAERLRAKVSERNPGRDLPIGVLDITLYRDDFSPGKPQPTVRPSQIPFSLDGTTILLIDDVFQTGRTIRAALTHLADFGRPRRVILGAFIERGRPELPIRPDHVGISIDLESNARVQLRLAEIDGRDEIVSQVSGEVG